MERGGAGWRNKYIFPVVRGCAAQPHTHPALKLCCAVARGNEMTGERTSRKKIEAFGPYSM
jgi:hypothetical protein